MCLSTDFQSHEEVFREVEGEDEDETAAPGVKLDRMLEDDEEDDDYEPGRLRSDSYSDSGSSDTDSDNSESSDSDNGSDDDENEEGSGSDSTRSDDASNKSNDDDDDEEVEESAHGDRDASSADDGSEIEDDEVAALLREAEEDLGPGVAVRCVANSTEPGITKRVLRERRTLRSSSDAVAKEEFQMPSGRDDIGRPVALLKGGVVLSGTIVGYLNPLEQQAVNLKSAQDATGTSSEVAPSSTAVAVDSVTVESATTLDTPYWSMAGVSSFDALYDAIHSQKAQAVERPQLGAWLVQYDARKGTITLTYDEVL